MPVDYSKWDALELSDDSDIEVHPNVDKRSFIRAKQNQIHQERLQRKHHIATLKYERIINDGFLRRIDALLAALQSHAAEAGSRSPDELMFQAVMESAPSDPADDQPPPRPEGVHSDEAEMPTWSKMMAILVDQVKKEVDADEKKKANGFQAYLEAVKGHSTKVQNLQKDLNAKLDELEREETKKITSESYTTGFSSSYVSKAEKEPESETNPEKKSSKKEKVQAVEVLNPKALGNQTLGEPQTSGADADIDEPLTEKDDDDEEVEPSELGKQFAQIKMGDYRTCLEFISRNPKVLAERETDGLLVMAFNSQLRGQDELVRQCVHHALLLQYCRSLGRDGVGLFFKRITTKGHQAQKVFFDDVNATYDRIRSRSKEISAERAEQDPNDQGGVEQIQLHAVDPGTTIGISIPPADSEIEEEKQARALFDSFPPGLQRALESASLDEVNKVLGKMSVSEAEEVVAKLSEGGMLSVEEQIIDATTEEGQAALKAYEENERAQQAQRAAEAGLASKYSEDPE